jgi:DNA-binding MarR family transcriptional regulator
MPLLSAEPGTPSRAFATPGLLVAQVGRAATRRYKAALSPIGLKPRPTAALMQLRREGPISQQALAESLDIDPANLVAVLNQLEHEGLATRRRDPADRRRHVVEITKRGVKRLDQVERAIAEVEDALFSALDPDERLQLQQLLARVSPGNYWCSAEADADTEGFEYR